MRNFFTAIVVTLSDKFFWLCMLYLTAFSICLVSTLNRSDLSYKSKDLEERISQLEYRIHMLETPNNGHFDNRILFCNYQEKYE